MTEEWKSKKESFEVTDVRALTGNFLPLLLKKAGKVTVGDGMCVVHSFEPVPLYSAMADLGFEHRTDKVSDTEYRVYFYRRESKEASTGMDVPLKPLALLNVKEIDNGLADIMVHFWDFVWGREKPAIDEKTRYILSLANGVGAGRFRQATRELVKAYSAGVTVAELDELFSLFVWNQGMGTFASEIGPSPLFNAYMLVKRLESQGQSREEVMKELVEKFGEKSPETGVLYKEK
jgi:alkylhydroperoxidase/carboxymuconolactone decarboxylase family protein YurZ